MPNIIKDGSIISDNYQVVSDKDIADAAQLPTGDIIIPLEVWKKVKAQLQDRTVGVWLDSDELPENIQADSDKLSLIAINFPAFADGRGYSYAHTLRAQYSFEGELRAIGDVLKDQLAYMKRVGFNSFVMRADQELEECLNYFDDFKRPYQAAIDIDTPLFAER